MANRSARGRRGGRRRPGGGGEGRRVIVRARPGRRGASLRRAAAPGPAADRQAAGSPLQAGWETAAGAAAPRGGGPGRRSGPSSVPGRSPEWAHGSRGGGAFSRARSRPREVTTPHTQLSAQRPGSSEACRPRTTPTVRLPGSESSGRETAQTGVKREQHQAGGQTHDRALGLGGWLRRARRAWPGGCGAGPAREGPAPVPAAARPGPAAEQRSHRRLSAAPSEALERGGSTLRERDLQALRPRGGGARPADRRRPSGRAREQGAPRKRARSRLLWETGRLAFRLLEISAGRIRPCSALCQDLHAHASLHLPLREDELFSPGSPPCLETKRREGAPRPGHACSARPRSPGRDAALPRCRPPGVASRAASERSCLVQRAPDRLFPA